MKTFSEGVSAAAQLALGRLGWTPDEFWAATPAELSLMLDGLVPEQSLPLDRQGLKRLETDENG